MKTFKKYIYIYVKKKKRKEKKGRGESKTEKARDPSRCDVTAHAMTPLPTHDAIAHAHTRKTHLAA